MVRIAHSNRLPDSLPVVLKLLEAHGEGATISELQTEIEEKCLWNAEDHLGPRARYYRIYNVLKLLRKKGIVKRQDKNDRDGLWFMDQKEYANQRRKEISEVIQPLVDGCLMVSDPLQFVGQVNEMIQDGTIDVMLAERRARARRLP